MRKFLSLLVGVIVLSKSNGNLISGKPAPTPDEEFTADDWSELDVIYPDDPYSESFGVPEKRPNRDALMRRSTLDKNFMRFGRSGFSQGCCGLKDLVEFAERHSRNSEPTLVTKTDSNFMRFGRGGKDNFMRFGRGGDNFMRFGRSEKDKGNFMRFGRGGSDNFMRFGKAGGDNFMRFGRPEKDKGNFMRFGRVDKGNFMRFGRDDKGNFMRFGRGGDDNFIRFGRGDKDNFIRFGRGEEDTTAEKPDAEEESFWRPAKGDNFSALPKAQANFNRYGKSGGGKDGFIRFGKSGRNGTNFLQIGLEPEEDGENGDGTRNTARRKRTTTTGTHVHDRITRSPELMEDVLPGTRRPSIEEEVTKPNLLKFISLINRNHPNWEGESIMSFLPPAEPHPLQKPKAEIYKRKDNGSGFIRFG